MKRICFALAGALVFSGCLAETVQLTGAEYKTRNSCRVTSTSFLRDYTFLVQGSDSLNYTYDFKVKSRSDGSVSGSNNTEFACVIGVDGDFQLWDKITVSLVDVTSNKASFVVPELEPFSPFQDVQTGDWVFTTTSTKPAKNVAAYTGVLNDSTWEDAQTWCTEESAASGLSWRLPDFVELRAMQSLSDFDLTKTYWSSNTVESYPDKALVLECYGGKAVKNGRTKTNACSFRPVRNIESAN